jgi:hypothetical protein
VSQQARLDAREGGQRAGDGALRHQREAGGERVRQRRLRRQHGDGAVQPGTAAAAWVQQMREAAGRIEDEPRVAGGRQRAVGQFDLAP